MDERDNAHLATPAKKGQPAGLTIAGKAALPEAQARQTTTADNMEDQMRQTLQQMGKLPPDGTAEAVPQNGPEPIGGKIPSPFDERRNTQRSTADIMSTRQKQVTSESMIKRAGLNPEGFNEELGLVTFSDPTNRSPKVAALKVEDLLQGGPEAAKAEMQRVLSQPEPIRAGKNVAKEPQQPAGVARGVVPPSSLQRGDTGFVHPRDVQLRPKEFQYKKNVNERDVTNQFVGNKFNEDLMGIVHTFKDPETGELAAVNGHHRVDMAQTDNAPRIRVHVLDTDNPVHAKGLGALQNIAEGNGTAYDAAVFLKQSKFTPEELKNMGISLSAPKVESGLALSRLDHSILEKVGTGEISESRGAAIGKATSDPATQQGILDVLAKREAGGRTVPDATVAEIGRIAEHAGNYSENTLSLFGPEQKTNSLILDVADVSAFVKREIMREKSVFGSVANEDKAQKLSKAGNTINTGENQRISKEAALAAEVYDKLSLSKGPINDAIVNAARRIRNGEDAAKVKAQAYEAVRREISTAIPGGSGSNREALPEEQGPR